jgi:hypothetical protein
MVLHQYFVERLFKEGPKKLVREMREYGTIVERDWLQICCGTFYISLVFNQLVVV